MLPWKDHSKIEKRWLSCKPSGATLTAQNLCWLTAMGRDSLVGAKEALPRLSPHLLIVLYSYYILSLCIGMRTPVQLRSNQRGAIELSGWSCKGNMAAAHSCCLPVPSPP